MKKLIFIIFSSLLLSSCYSLFYNSADTMLIGAFNNPEYYDNIDSWIGRSVDDLINSWGKSYSVYEYEDQFSGTMGPYNNIEKGEKVYLWSDSGTITYTKEVDDICDSNEVCGTHTEYEEKFVSCYTGILVDYSGYIMDAEPVDYSRRDCVEGVKEDVLYFPMALK